jgi:hypothetical protein
MRHVLTGTWSSLRRAKTAVRCKSILNLSFVGNRLLFATNFVHVNFAAVATSRAAATSWAKKIISGSSKIENPPHYKNCFVLLPDNSLAVCFGAVNSLMTTPAKPILLHHVPVKLKRTKVAEKLMVGSELGRRTVHVWEAGRPVLAVSRN